MKNNKADLTLNRKIDGYNYKAGGSIKNLIKITTAFGVYSFFILSGNIAAQKIMSSNDADSTVVSPLFVGNSNLNKDLADINNIMIMKESLRIGNDDNETQNTKNDKAITDEIWSSKTLADYFWNLNEAFLNSGFQYEFGYTGDVFHIPNSNPVYLDNFDLIIDADLYELLNWKGATVHSYIIGNNGQIPNEFVNSIQGISNIAAYNTWKLYEFWIQQNLFNDRLSLLFGLLDLNSEFDLREVSSLFINPSHGIGVDFAQTGLNGPSIFPNTSLAFRVNIEIIENTFLRAAIFDGVPGNINNPNGTHVKFDADDGALIATELSYECGSFDDFNKGFSKYAFGGWFYTEKFEALQLEENNTDPIFTEGNFGLYAFMETNLLSENGKSEEGLAFFGRVGFCNNKINEVDYYLGGGLVYKGLIPGRDDDKLGIALASAKNNPKIRAFRGLNNFENNLEITYSFEITPWLTIQPDLQIFIGPSGNGNHSKSNIFGTRLSVNI